MRFADQEQDVGASHGGPGGLMGAQGGPQAYSQEPIYTPRILRDPGEPPVSRPSQPHVQFDMGGVRIKTTWIERCEDENLELFRCNIFHPTYLPTLALQANRGELLNGDHPNHLLHLLQGDPIRLDDLQTSTSSNCNHRLHREHQQGLLVDETLYLPLHLLLPMSLLILVILV